MHKSERAEHAAYPSGVPGGDPEVVLLGRVEASQDKVHELAVVDLVPRVAVVRRGA